MMKHLFLLVLLAGWACSLTAQKKMNTYETAWKTVDSLWQQKGLPESALAEVRKIYAMASKEGNAAEQVKSLLYMGQLTAINTEDADSKQIAFLEKNLAGAKDPVRSLLHSMLGTAYWQYYQEHRWEIQERTATTDKGEDVQTWSAEDLKAAILKHFNASLENKEFLQREKLDAYGPVMVKGTPSAAMLRPTLYDLLAHTALSYYAQEGDYIMPKPYGPAEGMAGKPRVYGDNSKEDFQQDNVVFAPAEAFASHRFTAEDSSNLHFQAILLYQELTRFRLRDAKADALLDLELARLQFAKAQTQREDGSFLFMKALSFLEKGYPANPAVAQAAYLRIQEQYRDEEASTAERKPTQEAGLRPSIAAECRRVIQTWPASEGALNAARLLQELEKKEFSLQAEKVNIPGQPFRMRVQYRNIGKIHYRIIPVTEDLKALVRNRWDDQLWHTIKAQKAIRETEQALPAAEDLRSHAVEIKVDALEPGHYAILASIDGAYPLEKNALSLQYIYVSSIAYIQQGEDFFVLDRETGKPLSKAQVKISYISYDYTDRKQKPVLTAELVTGLDGYFRLPKGDRRQTQYQLDIRHGKDRLAMNESYYDYQYEPEDKAAATYATYEKENRRLWLFTDRSIYRPGQIVYFKGLLVTRDFDTKRYKVVDGISSSIILNDTEGEEIDSLPVKTNEFGTFTGQFRIPETVMTGEFSLHDGESQGSVSFNVEEYKRPTFYVEYEPVKGAIRLQDTVRVKGTVRAYAGNARNGAEVKYRVTRGSRFPFPWLARGIYIPYRPPVEIAHGEVTADENGHFTIPFQAIPDKTIDPKTLPEFEYRVSVDVTDAGGETRSAETTVQAGYHVLNLDATVENEGQVPANKNATLLLNARNLNGEPLSNPVQVNIYPLQSPNRLIRPRLWPAPDTFIMAETEFLKSFPHDEYREESKLENWPRGKVLHTVQDSLKEGKAVLTIPMSKATAGWYLVEVTGKDPFGQQVRTETRFRVLPDAKGTGDILHYFTSTRNSSRLEPGETGVQTISTSLPELWVIRQVDRPGAASPLPQEGKQSHPKKTVAMETPGHAYEVLSLRAGRTEFNIPVTESDRGGFATSAVTVRHNRFFTTTEVWQIPWSNQELDIKLTTFREKTEPGAEESWTVQIGGPKGEKWAAEILTSMYDASLDQFRYHGWEKPSVQLMYPYNKTVPDLRRWEGERNFISVSSLDRPYPDTVIKILEKNYDALLWDTRAGQGVLSASTRVMAMRMNAAPPAAMADSAAGDDQNKRKLSETGDEGRIGTVEQAGAKDEELHEVVVTTITEGKLPGISVREATPASTRIRTDFRETVFFFPDLRTDSAGNVKFRFTMPDALTTWKWQVLAHTKDLAVGMAVRQIVTQKELMVQPNTPRFLREGDQLVFPARITNMGDVEVTGQAELQVLDAETGQVVDGLFNNLFPVQYFTAGAKQGTVVNFPLQVPGNFSKPVTYRIIAKTKQHSDGEEQSLPVLSNRILLTESLPFFQAGPGTKNYSFDKLKNAGQSPTLTHQALTVELSTNPAWYAVQALPYLTAYPFDCSEQVFNRFYGNALAAFMANGRPAIKTFYAAWMKEDAQGKTSLLSKLEKNPELKSILLQETPWVLDAQQQSEQLMKIAILFDDERLSKDMEAALAALEKAQSPNGGFVWFPGGPDDRYITQYIIAGIGKLKKSGAVPAKYRERLDAIAQKGLTYMHTRIREDYEELKRKKADLNKQQIGYLQAQYLYTISFYLQQEMKGSYLEAMMFYQKQARMFWIQQPRQLQAMIALALWRSQDGKTPTAILASLKEKAIKNDALGMYWKRGANPWYWQEADLESQAILIEAFSEITKDENSIAMIKQWLLTQKQTSHWESTRATADACYALLLRGSDWLSSNLQATVSLGSAKTLDWKNEKTVEAGTGYRKSVIPGSEITPAMGDVRVTLSDASGKSNGTPAWGSVYWQYFEQLENVTAAGGPLSVQKKLYRSVNTEKGPVLEPVSDGDAFRVGDKLVVRLEIRSDRDMEYVHLKDMRASGTEPVNVLSGYRWQGSLGYYESTRDAATNFFFPRVSRGTYVFEYPLFITQEGSFSTGPATIQCLYAPEFAAQSQGFRLKVKSNP